MRTHCAIAIAIAVVTSPVAHAQPLVTPERPDARAPRDPANSAHCEWGATPHAHEAPTRGGVPGVSTTLVLNGDPSNRIDLVIVGDGYTASELGLFAEHAQRGVDDLFSIMPFSEYASLFNVHRVDVISNESGVDGDPTRDIERDNALGMSFWCGGTQRLLCANTLAVRQAADNAPDWDQVFAVANSTTYGGAGYTSQNIGTYAGGNGSAAQVAIHELGHSLGDLADEYTYGGPAEYTGPEPSAANVSVLNAAQMQAQGAKWSAWIGENDAEFDGLVDTFEGGNYSPEGIYRPSSNSMMRNLGREFNLPSAEALIIEMWQTVQPIDQHTSTALPVSRGATLEVVPVAPFLSVRWYVNGAYSGAARTLRLSSLALPTAESTVEAVVMDLTPLVRDEDARELYMTQRVSWTLVNDPSDVSGDGVVDATDLAILIAAFDTPAIDLDGDGVCTSSDIAFLLAAWDK